MAKKKPAPQPPQPTVAELQEKLLNMKKHAVSLEKQVLRLKRQQSVPLERRTAAPPATRSFLAATESLALGYWQRLVVLGLESLRLGVDLPHPADEGLELSHPPDLQTYVTGAESYLRDIVQHDEDYAALANAAKVLAAAHAAATEVVVTAPYDAHAANILDDLEVLSEAIKGDDRFTATLDILEAAAVAYGGG